MRKLLKSTIGAMAVGLGMMMVVGCENPNNLPEVPQEKTYTVVYENPFGEIPSTTVTGFTKEEAVEEARKIEVDLKNKEKLPAGENKFVEIEIVTRSGWNHSVSGTTITLTPLWKLKNRELEYTLGDSGDVTRISIGSVGSNKIFEVNYDFDNLEAYVSGVNHRYTLENKSIEFDADSVCWCVKTSKPSYEYGEKEIRTAIETSIVTVTPIN